VNKPQNLNELFFTAVERFGTKSAALRHKQGGAWKDITHHELAWQVHQASLGLRELGLQPGDRVAIISQNRPEWAISDYACLAARCVDVTIYPTLTPSQTAYVLNDSRSRAVIVEDQTQYDKVMTVRSELESVENVIVFDAVEGMNAAGVLSFQELLNRGAAAEPRYPTYREDALAVKPDDVATLIYTSGTTGPPKGVMLTHKNLCSNVIAALHVLSIGTEDQALSAAPLSHSFERMAGHYTMLHAGATISYAESIERLPDNLVEVRPTVMIFAPRLYEKLYSVVREKALSGGTLKRHIFLWACRSADRWADLKLAQRPVPATIALKKAIADKLVFSKLKERTGGRIRFFVSGAAPLNPDVAKFFFAAGLPITEGYGLTETSPTISVNPLEAIRIGTVGPPLPDVEVKIAPDGEVLTRGPHVMLGYYNKPAETAEAIDPEGWFHTGDIGEFDSAGYLKITDRKKDIIVTAGGKNIAPQPIESMVRNNQFVLNAVMIGDKRRFPSLLVVPDIERLKAWGAEQDLEFEDAESFLARRDVTAKMEQEVMSTLQDLAKFEMPKKLLLLAEDFSLERGEITPTLKVKRYVVEEKYKEKIEAIYAEQLVDDPTAQSDHPS
jgi:long-chain acyl-CoA synthetase